MEALSSHRLPALLGRITLTLVLLALIASLWGWGQGSEEPRGKLRSGGLSDRATEAATSSSVGRTLRGPNSTSALASRKVMIEF